MPRGVWRTKESTLQCTHTRNAWFYKAIYLRYWCEQFCNRGGTLSMYWWKRAPDCVCQTKAESLRRYCVTRTELLAVVQFCKDFKHYLYDKIFTARTDHESLCWLLIFKNPKGQLARWQEVLSVCLIWQLNIVLVLNTEMKTHSNHCHAINAVSRQTGKTKLLRMSEPIMAWGNCRTKIPRWNKWKIGYCQAIGPTRYNSIYYVYQFSEIVSEPCVIVPLHFHR